MLIWRGPLYWCKFTKCTLNCQFPFCYTCLWRSNQIHSRWIIVAYCNCHLFPVFSVVSSHGIAFWVAYSHSTSFCSIGPLQTTSAAAEPLTQHKNSKLIWVPSEPWLLTHSFMSSLFLVIWEYLCVACIPKFERAPSIRPPRVWVLSATSHISLFQHFH